MKLSILLAGCLLAAVTALPVAAHDATYFTVLSGPAEGAPDASPGSGGRPTAPALATLLPRGAASVPDCAGRAPPAAGGRGGPPAGAGRGGAGGGARGGGGGRGRGGAGGAGGGGGWTDGLGRPGEGGDLPGILGQVLDRLEPLDVVVAP